MGDCSSSPVYVSAHAVCADPPTIWRSATPAPICRLTGSAVAMDPHSGSWALPARRRRHHHHHRMMQGHKPASRVAGSTPHCSKCD